MCGSRAEADYNVFHMDIGYTEEQEALRQELRAYYAELLTPEVEEQLAHANGVGEAMRAVVRRMGEDGWLGIGWPKEWGGQGRSAIEQFVFFDESMRAGAPVPMLTINTVGPTIMNFGTDEQKQFFLPKILKGEIHFCIGYTEPGAGTDLAALKTRAVRDGDEYVIVVWPPPSVWIGVDEKPGSVVSTIRIEMPLCLSAVGFVRQASQM